MTNSSDVQALIGKILAAPLEDAPETPVHTEYYSYDGSQWIPVNTSTPTVQPLKRFRLITWNIDVLSPAYLKEVSGFLDFYEEQLSKYDDRRFEINRKIEGNFIRLCLKNNCYIIKSLVTYII